MNWNVYDMWVFSSPEKLRSIAIGPRPTSFVVSRLLTIEHFSFYWKLFKFNVKYLWGKGNLNRKNQDGDGVNSANIWAIFKTLPQWKKKWIYSYANQVDCKFHDFRSQGFSCKSVVNGYIVESSISFKIFFSSPKHEADKLSIKHKVMMNIENSTKIVYLMILGAGVFELG